jgi:hypothetical protein
MPVVGVEMLASNVHCSLFPTLVLDMVTEHCPAGGEVPRLGVNVKSALTTTGIDVVDVVLVDVLVDVVLVEVVLVVGTEVVLVDVLLVVGTDDVLVDVVLEVVVAGTDVVEVVEGGVGPRDPQFDSVTTHATQSSLTKNPVWFGFMTFSHPA